MSDKYSRLALPQSRVRALSSMENYGNTQGDYAQLTPIAFKDIQQQGYFTEYTFEEVMGNPKLYDAAVAAFWDKGRPISSVPEDDRAMWWLNPAQYKTTGGDISKVKAFPPYNTDEKARKVFSDRATNYSRQRTLYNNTESSSLGRESEAEFS